MAVYGVDLIQLAVNLDTLAGQFADGLRSLFIERSSKFLGGVLAREGLYDFVFLIVVVCNPSKMV